MPQVSSGLCRPIEAQIGKTAKEQALDSVALHAVVLEQEEIGERSREVIDLDLGIHLRLGKFMQVPQQRHSAGIVAQAAQREGAVVREHAGLVFEVSAARRQEVFGFIAHARQATMQGR